MPLKNWIFRKLAVSGRNVLIGEKFHVGPFSRIWSPSRLVIGNNVYVGKYVTIEVDGIIGNGVLIANSVGIIGRRDHFMHDVGTLIRDSKWVGTNKSLSSPIEIQSDVWIGYGAVILAPVKIGHSAIVAAGSVVIKDVPPFAIVGGNPAIIVGERFKTEEERNEHIRKLGESGSL